MSDKLEKTIVKAVETLLENNHEIIEKMVVEITKNEVLKVLEDLLGDNVRKKVKQIIDDNRERILARSEEILLVYDGGDSDLKEVDEVAEANIDGGNKGKKKTKKNIIETAEDETRI